MVTPLGKSPDAVLRRIEAEDTGAIQSSGFDPNAFSCPVCCRVADFEPQPYASEAKMVRLMNRDAQFAVAAARLALEDAGVKVGKSHPAEEVGLFCATGLAGLPLSDITPLIEASADPEGGFDTGRFGHAGLKAVSPVLSFKILSNMPLCFVSINENIQGPNGVYTPWEGQGAQAVEAGMRALAAGDARCVLVGGCDVKTHELAFASLEQQGLFRSWGENGRGRPRPGGTPSTARGIIPGEGAVFLVLESAQDAIARGAHIYAKIAGWSLRTIAGGSDKSLVRVEALRALRLSTHLGAIVGAANGEQSRDREEKLILEAARHSAGVEIFPKKYVGDLFAAAAVLQLGLGALLAEQCGRSVLANCFSHGSVQAVFALDPP